MTGFEKMTADIWLSLGKRKTSGMMVKVRHEMYLDKIRNLFVMLGNKRDA